MYIPSNHQTSHHLLVKETIGRVSKAIVSLLGPWDTKLVHLHSQLEQIIQTFTLGLRFGDIVTPDITTYGLVVVNTNGLAITLTFRVFAPKPHKYRGTLPWLSPSSL